MAYQLNPFTPGVGQEPLFLSGRAIETESYKTRTLANSAGQMNSIIIGLRGVGKTVLAKKLAKIARGNQWLPLLREMSNRSNDENQLIKGILAELAILLKGVKISRPSGEMGFTASGLKEVEFGYDELEKLFQQTPGDNSDKLLQVFSVVAKIASEFGFRGLVILFDEFQLLEDQNQNYSLSLILDCISRAQALGSNQFHTVLVGLPTMISKIVSAKPHSERLFPNIIEIGPLDNLSARDAILMPLKTAKMADLFAADLIDELVSVTEGYPYFLQFFSYKIVETFTHQPITASDFKSILPELFIGLDQLFYAGRLNALTEKEKAVALASAKIQAPFSPTQLQKCLNVFGRNINMNTVQQYILSLQNKNILYKIKRGEYGYALPLFKEFLLRLDKTESYDSVLSEIGQ